MKLANSQFLLAFLSDIISYNFLFLFAPFFSHARLCLKLHYAHWLRLIILIVSFSLMTRGRAGCLVRTSRIAHDTACVPMRGGASSLGTRLSPRIYSHAAGDAPLGHRAAEPKQNGEHARRIYHAVNPLAARYTADIVNRFGKWSKRLAESCQRNRITSTGRPRLSESPVPVASGLQRLLQEISSIGEMDRSIFRANPRIKCGDLIRIFVSNKILIIMITRAILLCTILRKE